MELQKSDMYDRQRAFRATYRHQIAGWYNGWLHVAVIFVAGFAIVYVCGATLRDVALWEWLVVPAVFLTYQFGEYWAHRLWLHKPAKNGALRELYKRHTLQHHQFFTDHEMRFADHLDWRVTFFPPFTMAAFVLLGLPSAAICGLLISPNVGWLVMAAVIGSYMWYELVHFCCHVDDNWFLLNCPLINTARRHHKAHHNHSVMMEVNMGIGTPIFDWVYGTSDLNRGFFGHVFNGSSWAHVKSDLRQTARTPVVKSNEVPAALKTASS